MTEVPYLGFAEDELILRDRLAIERTLLANERTLLAYLRSGAGLLIAGISITHFSQQGWFWAAGIVCVPAGIVTGIIGAARYRRMNRAISLVRRGSVTGARKAAEDADSRG